MKNKKLVVAIAILAVLICLLLTIMLFFAVTPRFLVTLSLSIGVITGIFLTLLVQSLMNIFRSNKPE